MAAPTQLQEIERLIQLAAVSRSCLSEETRAFKHRVNLPARFKESLRSNPTGWILGSTAIGLAASLLFRRRPKAAPKKSHGLTNVLLGLTLTAVRPLVKLWLSGQLKNFVTARLDTPGVREVNPASLSS